MNDTAITRSIGAALQACTAQAHADQPVRQAPAAAGGARPAASPAHLTPRQLEVLSLLCEGLQNKLICRRLNIATGTVKVHISCILRELGVMSRLQAVVAARRIGLAGKPATVIPDQATAACQPVPVPRSGGGPSAGWIRATA